MTETPEIRLRRLKMRSIRRGIKEMDLILTDFTDRELARLDGGELDLYEALLEENDHDIYGWISGRDPVPERYAGLIGRIARGATGVTRP